MKPLQNPLVVSGLVLLALGLVFHSTFGSLRHWLFAARKPAVNAVTSVAPPGQPPSPVQPPAPSITDIIPGQSIDYSQVGWIRFQHRDPFGAAGGFA
ncbi:MAG: hypothetical protein M1608_10510, partial [Candidatus Omnitrophica bacterium]|nr:hypothetical protein [Candidatus Omnitrophota bacterium]